MAFIAFTAMAAAAAEAAAIEAAAIAAAELAAEQAAIAAAEQVATEAATQVATQAATDTAAQQGITQATQQAVTPGLEQVGTQGINSVAPGGEPIIDPNTNLPIEQIRQPVVNQAEVDQMTNVMANNMGSNPVYQSVGSPTAQVTASDVPITQTINQPTPNIPVNTANPNISGTSVQPGYLTNSNAAPTNSMLYPGQGAANSTIGVDSGVSTVSPGSGIKSGWEAATEWMGKNPMMTGMGIYAGLNATGALKQQNNSFNAEPYNGPLNNYRLSPNFKTYPTGPNTNIYRPTYAAEGGIMQAGGPVQRMSDMNQLGMNNPDYPMSYTTPTSQMANGGITSFARGGSSYSPEAANYYSNMMNQSNAMPAPSKGDAGVFVDSNPNTRRLNAPDAALYYQNALANRYGLHTGANLPKGAMGKVNTVPVMAKQKKSAADDIEAAAGGIMQAQHYNLGGYAHGGNPRLLRGPGDGMSDNIPATIENTQPARLADGEFVVPADVVSGLGNGSTEAGAKHLHKMMDKVRVARTGNKAQGKQINPNKFTPK
jgi:hypothetical protein